MIRILTYAVLMLGLSLASGCSNAPGTEQKPANTQSAYNPAPATSASTNTSAPTSSPMAANPTATASDGMATAAKGTVEVKLTEYKIVMPASIAAGATTFKVTNAGKEVHSFEVEGNGIEKEIESKLKVGETKTLQVELKPGTYKVYCPVDGHKMLGMSLDLTVK